MEYNDLNNENLPIEHRVKHLEREASFVRDYVQRNEVMNIVTFSLSVISIVLSLIALSK